MRVLVTGGLNYTDGPALWAELNEIKPSVLIHGNARGADTLAHVWCLWHPHVKEIAVDAPWGYVGPYAGPMRNIYMIEHHHPDRVLACSGDVGTENMVRNALARGVPVRRIP